MLSSPVLSYEEGDETAIAPPQRQVLPKDLQQYADALRKFFLWLWEPGNKAAAILFENSMEQSGGTRSMVMQQLYHEPDQTKWPWIWLEDPYSVRTAAGKVMEWLTGPGIDVATAEGMKFATMLRSYQAGN